MKKLFFQSVVSSFSYLLFLLLTPVMTHANSITSIGDFVWDDLNLNGIQDSGEPGASNITVNLLSGAGDHLEATTLTDSSGYYLFDELQYGEYIVEFILPENSIFAPQDQGADDAKDSDANPSTGQESIVTGDGDRTVDAGIYRFGEIFGNKFHDTNGNGVQDSGEPDLEGWQINLFDAAGNLLATTITDSSGFYSFSGLYSDTYTVSEALVSGWSPTTSTEVPIFLSYGEQIAVQFGNNMTPIPEPTTMLLFGTGLAGLAAIGRRKKT